MLIGFHKDKRLVKNNLSQNFDIPFRKCLGRWTVLVLEVGIRTFNSCAASIWYLSKPKEVTTCVSDLFVLEVMLRDWCQSPITYDETVVEHILMKRRVSQKTCYILNKVFRISRHGCCDVVVLGYRVWFITLLCIGFTYMRIT